MSKRALIIILLMVLFLSFVYFLQAQSVSQLGFVIKKALPSVENIAVLCAEEKKETILKETKTAILVTRKKFSVYKIVKRADIPKAMNAIKKVKNIAVLIISDSNALNQKSVKYLAQKLGMKKIPVITNRAEDTKVGAFLSIVAEGTSIKTHVNKVVLNALKLKMPAEFLATCVVDVE